MRKSVAKLFRILFTGSAFFVFWTGGALITWFVFPVVQLLHRQDPVVAQRRCRWILNRALRFHADYMRFFRLIEFDSRAVERQLPKGAFVLVSNHPSLIDVVLLLATCPTLYCLVKGPVMRSPFVGRMLRYCNHIDAGDGDAASGALAVQGAIERLRAGDPVLIFPEGTRSPIEGIGPFKKGAFMIAHEAKVPVVPIWIATKPRGLMRGMKWYMVPDDTMRYTFKLFTPMSTESFAGDARKMAADVRALFVAPTDAPSLSSTAAGNLPSER